MTELATATRQGLPPRPGATMVDWTYMINRLTAKSARAIKGSSQSRRSAGPANTVALLLTGRDGAGGTPLHPSLRDPDGYRMAPEVAEHLAANGLDPDFLGGLASCSGLDMRDVLDFVGIDRTTVGCRKVSGSALPHDAAVKALQLTELLTQATEVFGAPVQASTWLTRPHPALGGETPLQRARTPWGMNKVQSVLVALRFGAAA